jgi:hypothetical protein
MRILRDTHDLLNPDPLGILRVERNHGKVVIGGGETSVSGITPTSQDPPVNRRHDRRPRWR